MGQRVQLTPGKPGIRLTLFYQEKRITIYRPGPVQKGLSRFVVFLIKWQDYLMASLLVPVLIGTMAIAFGQWEIGAGFIVFAGITAFVALLLIVVAVFFNRVGVGFD